MEKDTLVYLHKRNDTGEVFYVGIGNSKRPHTKDSRNTHWFNIVNKHGYTVEIVKTDLTWEEACEEEIRLIKLYGRKDLGLGTLVNMTDGGDGVKGIKWSDESKEKQRINNIGKKLSLKTRKKMSISRSGEGNSMFGKTGKDSTMWYRTGEKNHMFGKTHSKETRKKMSESHKKGKSHHNSILSDEHVKFMRKHFIHRDKEYGLTGLAKKFNITKQNVKSIIDRKTWKHI